ncbi:MAG: DNA gyrase inhibitor YacG [Betaproteobacteria bacterium]
MKKVRCPQCAGISIYSTENRFRPFCSERCKMLDLGAWANDEYAIPGSTIETPVGADGGAPLPSEKLIQ